jgi:putative thiamine transport system permease protein
LVTLFNNPELRLRFPASAGALLQLVLVAAGIAFWAGLEWVVRRVGQNWISSGRRGGADRFPRFIAAAAFAVTSAAASAGLLSMILWSFAPAWRFPHAWPDGLTLANWTRHVSTLQEPFFNTIVVGMSATLIALALVIAALEQESRFGRRTLVTAGGFLYLPLLIPQIAFLFGGQILLVFAHLDGRWLALTWLHLVFVFPYVFLSLANSYRAWDNRYGRTGLCLGAAPFRIFLQIKLPMLLRPIMAAAAVGFAVSVGLYLPTLFAGNGRYPTLTTEAVTLSAGGDNRLLGIYALLQMVLPLLGFTLAITVPACFFRHRRAMQVTQ